MITSSQRLNNLDNKRQRFSIKSQGDSMYPLLQDGDIVEYESVYFKDISLNDIILVHVDHVLMTHRVIYKMKQACITRGDNNTTADIPIKSSQILGKALRFKRNNTWYKLQDTYTAQSTFYLNEIQKLETSLQFADVSHVFLKGVLISLHYLDAIPKRVYADCDLLINREDYKKTEKAFKVLGYKLRKPLLTFDSNHEKQSKPEINYAKKIDGLLVVFDVHFEPVFLMTQLDGMQFLYPKMKLMKLGEELIGRSRQYNIGGLNYPICSTSNQLLYLALHIFHHNYTDSTRYQFLDAIIRKHSTKKIWKEIQTTIHEYELEGYLYLVFILLKKHFKTPIPKEFITKITPSWIKKTVSIYYSSQIDIFSIDTQLKAGIGRFILVFLLSPNPIWTKIFLLFHPDTINALLTVIKEQGATLFKNIIIREPKATI